MGAVDSKSEHTPGPLAADGRAVVDQFGWMIGSAGGLYTSAQEDVANARLIAAAPDMLAALLSARAQLEAYEQERSGESYNDVAINAVIRFALTGERS